MQTLSLGESTVYHLAGPVRRDDIAALTAVVPGVEKWLPTAAAIGLTNAPGPDPGRVLSPAAAGPVLAGYAIALLLAVTSTTMRRDVA